MVLDTKLFRSKVARRIFLLFVSCALVPIIAATLISYHQVSTQMGENSRRQLMQTSKSEAMGIYGRLQLLSSELELKTSLLRQDMSSREMENNDHFVSLTIVPSDSLGLSPAERTHLAAAKSLLKASRSQGSRAASLKLMRLLDPQDAKKGIAVGEIHSAYLWDSGTLPGDVHLCVFDDTDSVILALEQEQPPQLTIRKRAASGYFEWKHDRVAYDSAYWTLPLKVDFFSGPWTIVLSQNHGVATSALADFRNTFPLVVLLALWAVLLLSMKQIRRTLVPLEKLRDGTEQIGAQHFDVRVDVRSGDEFEEVAESFNGMTKRLARQFEAAKTINEIDQAILTSLNRDGVIEAVLERMPRVLSCQGFAVVIFGDEPNAKSFCYTVERTDNGLTRRRFEVQAFSQDLQALAGNSDWLKIRAVDPVPAFLEPMQTLGMRCFTVFPICVDKKIFAALVHAELTDRELEVDDLHFIRQVAQQSAIAFTNVQLIEALERLHWGALTALARAIDAKSGWTAGHSERVTNLAMRIGKKIGLSQKDLKIIQRGGLLHDVGKIGIPATVLNKPDRLTTEEIDVMREHVNIGVRILEPIPGFSEALPIVSQHHEAFDGSGYPKGLAGEEINLYARVFAVADAFDAMTSDRPYRSGLSKGKAIELVKKQSGRQFDPEVVAAFLSLDEVRETEAAMKAAGV